MPAEPRLNGGDEPLPVWVDKPSLMTLSGRAIQSQWKNPILRDPWAEEAMRHIAYALSKQLTGVASWRLWKDIGPTIIATRAATFDLLTTRFLADHPNATVIHVGCGMDSRVFRINPPAGVQWFDVDYPDVIDLRRQLFPERDAAYHVIGAQLDDLGWLEDVPGDRPGLFIAEGVLHYLSETDWLAGAIAGSHSTALNAILLP